MSNRVAIVTGAAQGIGRAIALRLADDGLDVAVGDLASQAEALDQVVLKIREKGRKSIAVSVDVTVEKDVDNLVQQTATELGGLDVMVANAGIYVLTPFLQVTMEEWERVFNVNVKGVLLCYQAAARVMIEQNRGGRIIGACSIAGKRGAPTASIYGSSKSAVRSLTQSAACELGKYGITVNGYAPGLIDTAMLPYGDVRYTEMTNEPTGAYEARLNRQSALGRTGQPEDVAQLVSFLASKESGYITGQTVVTDGGIWFD